MPPSFVVPVMRPYYLMFGRHPRLPIDVFLGLAVDDAERKFKNEYTRKLRHRLASAYRLCYSLIQFPHVYLKKVLV